MEDIKENSTNIVLSYLKKFLEGRIINLSQSDRKNPKIYHYYIEIVRNWNKLNFIVNKTLRSLKINDVEDKLEFAKYLFSAYRIIWENALLEDINTEISLKNSRIFSRFKTFSMDKALDGKSKEERLSIQEAIPTFVIQHLSNVMSIDFLRDNIKAMNRIGEKKDFTVYMNKTIEKILNLCAIGNLQKFINLKEPLFRKDPNISFIYNIPSKYKSEIINSDLYKSGDLIIQDKASATVVYILFPQPNEFICDMCAAPGMKTSLISHYTENISNSNKTKIIASEFLLNRAYQMKDLMNRQNISNSYIINTDSIKLPVRFKNIFDKVLLDAPCTGSGTFLTNPELKWRQNEKFLSQNVILQKKLLKSAVDLLKTDGILVYSTCSLYPEEGEFQILDIVDKVEPMELPKWLSPSYEIEGKILQGTGRLFPSVHQTQGFFIGKFKKKKR